MTPMDVASAAFIPCMAIVRLHSIFRLSGEGAKGGEKAPKRKTPPKRGFSIGPPTQFV